MDRFLRQAGPPDTDNRIMPAPRIVSRYIFTGFIPPFLVSGGVLVFIFLMTRILEITDMVVNYHVNLWVIARLFLYTMPFFLQFVIPMSVMMAVLLTFLQLSSNNEITALKASGVSVYQLLPPVLIFALTGALMTAAVAIVGLPKGRLAIRDLLYAVATDHTEVGLKERTFSDAFTGVMIYVNRIDTRTQTLHDVFIEDHRDPRVTATVVAATGRLIRPEGKKGIFHLRLDRGTINQVDLESRTAHTIQFDNYEVRLNMSQVLASAVSGEKDEEEMTLGELAERVRASPERDSRYYMALMEIHKKFSLPFSCIALAVLAVPLGIQSRLAKRSFGVGLGLFFFLCYYILLSIGWVFGETGAYPPGIGMWVPNVLMGGIGGVLLFMTAQERSVGVDRLVWWLRTIRRRFRRTAGGAQP